MYFTSYTKVAFRMHGRWIMVTAIPHLCMGAKLRLLMKINRLVSIFCVSTNRALKTVNIWAVALQRAACSHIVTVYILYKFHNNLGSSVYHLLFLQARPANQPTITGLVLCRKEVRGPLFGLKTGWKIAYPYRKLRRQKPKNRLSR